MTGRGTGTNLMAGAGGQGVRRSLSQRIQPKPLGSTCDGEAAIELDCSENAVEPRAAAKSSLRFVCGPSSVRRRCLTLFIAAYVTRLYNVVCSYIARRFG